MSLETIKEAFKQDFPAAAAGCVSGNGWEQKPALVMWAAYRAAAERFGKVRK